MSALFNVQNAEIPEYPPSASVIPFEQPTRKTQAEPCIFCGRTWSVYIFKGKTVCRSCLQHIPEIFRCG